MSVCGVNGWVFPSPAPPEKAGGKADGGAPAGLAEEPAPCPCLLLEAGGLGGCSQMPSRENILSFSDLNFLGLFLPPSSSVSWSKGLVPRSCFY